ncbi:hypothetical protein [Polyangium aurulentum]|uniref:hypothetical protein n=1 Tax=Polyangium aurulentum TaxID=2567896 RepID=UPI00197E3E55|nr:hypothetical protein [Polyangium aurulentum]UQA57217.1 hypothetical protein E8A73_038915 [Polyangium aurulentum]
MSGGAEIAVVSDYASWRGAARGLVARGVHPSVVVFREAGDTQGTLPGFGDAAPPASAHDEAIAADAIRVPRKFAELAEIVARHRDPVRWALLYRVLYRIVHENRRLLEDAADEDVRLVSVMRR